MKKLCLILAGCLAFCACEPVELEDWFDAEPSNPNPVYVFPAVDDGMPLSFHLIRQIEYEDHSAYLSTTGYSKRLLVIATVDAAWDKTQTFLPYFDKMAAHFADTELEFALLFMNYDKAQIAALPEVQNLQNVRAFYNTQSRCQNRLGLCTYVLESVSNDSPQLHYIAKDKAMLYPSNSAWPAGNDAEVLDSAYENMVKHVQGFLDKFAQ